MSLTPWVSFMVMELEDLEYLCQELRSNARMSVIFWSIMTVPLVFVLSQIVMPEGGALFWFTLVLMTVLEGIYLVYSYKVFESVVEWWNARRALRQRKMSRGGEIDERFEERGKDMTEEERGLNYYLEWKCSQCGAKGSVVCGGHREGRRFLEEEGWLRRTLTNSGGTWAETYCPDCKMNDLQRRMKE